MGGLMRGSMNYQIGRILNEVRRIGVSKHESKLMNKGRSPFIHSVQTREKYYANLVPLIKYLLLIQLNNIENLCSKIIKSYLTCRLEYHTSKQNSLSHFRAELAALSKLETGLNAFSKRYRGGKVQYDFGVVRAQFSNSAKFILQKFTSTYADRAYKKPQLIINHISNISHKLQAQLQFESGARSSGVGAPQSGMANVGKYNGRTIRGLTYKNLIGIVKDPVTNKNRGAYLTCEKGGKVSVHYCDPDTYKILNEYLICHSFLSSEYSQYLHSVTEAAIVTNEYRPGKGTHGLRHSFAQNRYIECLQHGYTDEEAKACVSAELNHNRADITETYLK